MSLNPLIMRCYRKLSLNYITSFISCKLKLLKSLGMPSTFIIEPTNICDHKCLICETGLGIIQRKKGYMKMPEFQIIADKILPYAYGVSLYWMGEPMLNPSIYDMIVYLKGRKPGIYVSIASNGNFIDPDRVIESGLDKIEFKLDGIDQETHCKYRVGGSYDKIVTTVKSIMDIKRRKNIIHPHVSIGMIVMRHNEHQIKEWEDFCCNELKCDSIRLVTPSVRTVEQARELLPKDRRFWRYDENEMNYGNLISKSRPGHKICEKVWDEVAITWEGNVSPCCEFLDDEVVLGNLLKDSLANIWNNEKMQNFRRIMCSIEKEKFRQCLRCTNAKSFSNINKAKLLRFIDRRKTYMMKRYY